MMIIKLRKSLFSLLDIFLIVVLLLLAILVTNYATYEPAIPNIVIPVDQPIESSQYANNYEYSTDWFSAHLPIWDIALKDFKGKKDLQYLEIGVFEGRTFFWMLDNILTGSGSRATAIDLFEKSKYVTQYSEFHTRFFNNLRSSDKSESVEVISGFSQVELRKLPLNHYDIIYIDGSHENIDVLEDAILSWRLLKSGGILIFDDYNKADTNFTDPRLGINSFFQFFGSQFEVLHCDYQLFLRKK